MFIYTMLYINRIKLNFKMPRLKSCYLKDKVKRAYNNNNYNTNNYNNYDII